jgi:hypothetical protein
VHDAIDIRGIVVGDDGETGTSTSGHLCVDADCVIYDHGPGYSLAAELIDVDGDDNLDLAALVVIQD